jgi:Ca2+-binding EF-hand superfamily protein
MPGFLPAGGRVQSGERWGRQTAVTDTDRYADSFRILDADGDGRISATELVQLMRGLGDDVTDDAAAEAVALMDTDGDDLISLQEFADYQASRGA